jgi:pimeloyl-ACP methyl ester carboxylesterase
MLPMAAALEQAGWTVANIGYASTRLDFGAHAAAVSQVARALAEDGATDISFVGHSLGGLVASAATQLAPANDWQVGRVVLVGTPARGAAIARAFSDLPGYKSFLGPCGETLTPPGAARVPRPSCRGVAVIAGGTGKGGFNPLLAGDNDFTVKVEETHLPDADFLLVRAMHNPLVRHRRTIAAAAGFLETGKMK